MLQGIAGDLRLALRSLRGSSTTTLAAILTLALGIGATTAVFSVANGLLLRPLPVAEPHRLVTVTSATALRFGFQAGVGWNYAMWDRFREGAEAFDGGFTWTFLQVAGSDGGEAQPLNALIASGGVFEALGVHALAGRTFTAADDVRGGGPDGGVVVISEALWQRRFGGTANVLGSRLSIEGTPLTIVGIIPKSFRGVDVGQPFDVAMPFSAEALVHGDRALRVNQRALLLTVMLRLKPGQTLSDATAAMRAMQPKIIAPGAPPFMKDPFIVVPASTGISDRSQLRQRYERPLVVLTTVSALVLGIVCVSIANLLLARAAARRYEVSLRLAVGASRWKLARQVLVEGLVLCGAGAVAGVLLAMWASRALVAQLPASSGTVSIDVPADWRVLAFATGVSLITVVFFATAPALYASRVAPREALQEQGRMSAGGGAGLVTLGLIALQVALSIVLLAGAGLFIQTFNRLVSVPLGFEPKGVLVVTVHMPRSLAESAARTGLFDRIRTAIEAVPGAARVAGSIWTPVGTGGGGLLTDARGRRADVGRGVLGFNFVTPGWFAIYGTSLRAGRDFDAGDSMDTARVAIVNEAFRRGLLSSRAAIGETIDAGPCGSARCTVIGVVADAVYGNSLRDAPPPVVYVPLAQAADLRPNMPLRLSMRAAGSHESLLHEVRAALSRVDPRLTYTFRVLADDVLAAVAQERLVARLAGFFGAVALLLSAVGLYGVISHTVARQRGEIAVRLALGARGVDIVRLMLTSIGMCVLAGTVVGLLAAVWLSRFVAPLLYGLDAADPATLVGAAATLASVAVLAVWRPASRAVRIDPAHLLRET
jgi:putative ABC transport system permease protein